MPVIELIAFALIGCALGVFTGLTPGIHVNTISVLALALGFYSGAELAVLVIAMGITHSFVDFIPSILFGAPDTDTFLGVLPGHRMLLQGKGLKAVQLTIAGGLFGAIGALLLGPVFMAFVSALYGFLPAFIPFILGVVLSLMVLSEKGVRKKLASLGVIGLSALLGVSVLRLNPFGNALMVSAIGFFAVSTLVYSVAEGTALKKQTQKGGEIKKSHVVEGSLLSIAGASTVSILPGIGPGQAAFIAARLAGKTETEPYLVMLGGINTANVIFSLFVMLAIGRIRTGIAAVVSQALSPGYLTVFLFAGAILFAVGFSILITGSLAVFLVKRVHLIPYRKVNIAVLGLLALVVLSTSGAYGLLVSCVSAAIGLVAVTEKVKRTHCMAFLIVPTILLYLGL